MISRVLGIAHDVMSSRVVPGQAAESDGAGTDAREPWAAGYYTLLQDVASVVSTSRGLIFSGPNFVGFFSASRQAAQK